jgi:hypothetical protein
MLNDMISSLRNYPVKLHWAGWETTTLQLQQAGWSLSAWQNPVKGIMQIGLRQPSLSVEGMTECREDWCHYDDPRAFLSSWHRAALHTRLAQQIHLHRDAEFRPFDAEPFYHTRACASLDDICHFAPAMTRTRQIILPEQTVDEMLQLILAKQQGAKEEYYRQQVLDERVQQPRQQFHAQILSFARAAA